jgi:hypothetical protein
MPASTSASKQPSTQLKYTVPFISVVNEALKKASVKLRMESTVIIQKATINFLIDQGFITAADAYRIKLFWALVDRAVQSAQQICRSGRFASSITLDAIHDCMSDTTKLGPEFHNWTWTEGYREYVADDIYKNGNPEKGPINREIGFRIRAGIGGFVEKDDTGKAKTAKVLGEIIQSYTPMADFDREEFKARA